jgi:glutamate-1-semialdehyde 2,1-aminomutase
MLRKELRKIIEETHLKAQVAGFGSIFVEYFTEADINNYGDLLTNDDAAFKFYRENLIKQGIFEIPFRLKRSHISASHTREDVNKTIDVARKVLEELSSKLKRNPNKRAVTCRR